MKQVVLIITAKIKVWFRLKVFFRLKLLSLDGNMISFIEPSALHAIANIEAFSLQNNRLKQLSNGIVNVSSCFVDHCCLKVQRTVREIR